MDNKDGVIVVTSESEKNHNTFEEIKHIDKQGNEYWCARELQRALEYKEWRKFEGVINKAKIAFHNGKFDVEYDFVEVDKIVKAGAMSKKIRDYKLSRHACYLIVQNGDSRKEVIALGQIYFAVQTRKQEIAELEYKNLSENEKRFYVRSLTKKGNYFLNQTAKKSGVKNFDKFHNAGYKGLYNGETADDIAKRKGLRYREDILDNMGSSELATNLFRIDQTNQKLINDNIRGESKANWTHYKIGNDIREFIKKQGETLPEGLPTPEKNLKQLEKENKFINSDK